jgi:glycosyltransferase involved in cell wall biosynthesis
MVLVDWLADTIFSLFYIKKCDFLLIGFGASTRKIIKKAKEKKIKTIYFLNTTSSNYQKIVEEEYNKLALSKLYFKEPKTLTNRIKESIKMADYVGALSSSQKQTYIDDGFDESKMFLSLMGVDTSVFFPKKIEKNKFVVITNGNNFVRKGIKYLIEAFNSLKLNSSELWIVGKNDKNLAKKIVKIEKNNIFKDRLLYEFELPNLYNQASVFCLPSFEEGLPAVIPQAMACALPIISTHFVNDIVTNGQEGFIIKPGDTLAIAEKIKFFYDNPNKAIEMGNKARTKAENVFSYDLIAKRIVNFCNKNHNFEE